jgi:hypothetical protein
MLSVMITGTKGLYAGSFGSNGEALATGQMPDCPIEAFKGSWGDVDLLDAIHKFGNPAKLGGGGKVIVILRDKQTDKLDESGGFTTTSVRYTVTFKRI